MGLLFPERFVSALRGLPSRPKPNLNSTDICSECAHSDMTQFGHKGGFLVINLEPMYLIVAYLHRRDIKCTDFRAGYKLQARHISPLRATAEHILE